MLLLTTRSMRPSPLKSPKAAPRLTSRPSRPGPAVAVTSAKRPPPGCDRASCARDRGMGCREGLSTAKPPRSTRRDQAGRRCRRRRTPSRSRERKAGSVEPGGGCHVGEAAASRRSGRATLPSFRMLVTKHVLITIAVVVPHRHTHSGLGLAVGRQRRAGEKAGILEAPVATIHPELIGIPIVGDVDVEPAVAVEVAHAYPEAGAIGRLEAGPPRDVREPAMPRLR